MEVEPLGSTIRVKRELEDGWFQNVTLPLPAVLTIQSGIKKLRYATLMGIKKAKTKEVKTIPASPAQPACSFCKSLSSAAEQTIADSHRRPQTGRPTACRKTQV